MLVIYHKNCPDGLASAWVFQQADAKTQLFAADHGTVPPFGMIVDQDVIMVDFVYNLEGMKALEQVARSVLVLDHHVTAQALVGHLQKTVLTLDMDRSGCQLAWDYVHPGAPRPWFLDDIADRDLWRWKRPGSREVTRALFGLGAYANLESFHAVTQARTREILVEMGKIFCESDRVSFEIIAKRAQKRNFHTPDGQIYEVGFLMCEAHQASDVGHLLCNEKDALGQPKYQFAVMARYDFDRRCFVASLRASDESPLDLSQIAAKFRDGGGHKKAAGCTLGTQQQLYDAVRSIDPFVENTDVDAYADSLIRLWRVCPDPGRQQGIGGPKGIDEAFAKRLRQRLDEANIPCRVEFKMVGETPNVHVDMGALLDPISQEPPWQFEWKPLLLCNNVRE